MSKANKQIEIQNKSWCEVGEHFVDKKDMWPNFGDCKYCSTEKEFELQTKDV